MTPAVAKSPQEMVAYLKDCHAKLRSEMAKVIVGQEDVIDQILICIFARGHCLLEGVPGLAKTLMISTLSSALSLDFSRIQFTPDLMPSDITGTEIIQEDKVTKERQFKFMKGPLFSSVILADEINRTPPKTQAALMEAMEEGNVTAGGVKYELDKPFFVLATQNPIEQEGTYPLPAAQLDRFMFKIFVDYPNKQEERDIIISTTGTYLADLVKVLQREEILELQGIVRDVPISEELLQYATNLARFTRVGDKYHNSYSDQWLAWGAGPRAAQYIILGAKAHACLDGRFNVTPQDVRAVTMPILRHRVIPNFNADSEAMTSDDIIHHIINICPRPAGDEQPKLEKVEESKGFLARLFG